MRQTNVSVEVAAKEGKPWPAAKFSATINVPTDEAEFVKLSNGVSSFDFAVAQYEKKAENAVAAAYKNQKEGDADTRIAKARSAAENFTLNSRGEGIRTAAKTAEAYLSTITDPAALAAVQALIAKAKGDKE